MPPLHHLTQGQLQHAYEQWSLTLQRRRTALDNGLVQPDDMPGQMAPPGRWRSPQGLEDAVKEAEATLIKINQEMQARLEPLAKPVPVDAVETVMSSAAIAAKAIRLPHDATFDPFDQPLQRLFTFTSPELALFPFTLLQGLALTHDDPIEPNTLTQMTSPTLVTSVYPLSTLQTYVQRPSAITKCFISDVYALRACVPADVQGTSYIGRDVYMLDQWPCRNVELVAWVVGVDRKEKAMTLTLDDGDGMHVLPVTLYLQQQALPVEPAIAATGRFGPSTYASSSSSSAVDISCASARERKAERKAAIEANTRSKTKEQVKVYVSPDIRVGDTVRVVGRINEWPRQRHGGQKEWVREVVVDQGSGGSIDVVHEDEQYAHTALVQDLHAKQYSKPFVLPPLPSSIHRPAPKSFSIDATFSTLSSPPQSLSELPSSEISEYSVDPEELKLRDPEKLRSTQLTEATYRQYVLDHMTQEVVRILADDSRALEAFPEYGEYGGVSSKHRSSSGANRRSGNDRALHDKTNSWSLVSPSDQAITKGDLLAVYSPSAEQLLPFSISDLLGVPSLKTLAHRVVEHTARSEEKRRLRRIKANEARPADLALERKRKAEGRDWRLTDAERQGRMERLTAYTMRGLHADGSIVHLQDGYVPLPPEMVLRLLVPHFERELWVRKAAFLGKDDPRRGNGALVEDLVKRLREWGEDGRWERVGEWVVLDAVRWGEERGLVRREGRGWWIVDAAFGRI